MQGVTYDQFAKLAQQRHGTVESVSARFRGKIEEPREFFTRVLKPSNSAMVIPYRLVIQFYLDAEAAKPAVLSRNRLCACGVANPCLTERSGPCQDAGSLTIEGHDLQTRQISQSEQD